MMTGDTLLVIPCFRESGRIGPFLQSLHEQMAEDAALTVLVVEDGSGEEERARMHELVERHRSAWPRLLPLLALEKNHGKGGAVYAGWAAQPDHGHLAFVDADGSCAAREVKRLVEAARLEPATAFFASRVCMLGRTIQRHFHRHLIGRVYATIVSEMLGIKVYDSQCGLKMLPAKAFRAVQPFLKVKGFAFDVELLCALLDSGCPVKELPIDWHEMEGGKVRLFSDSVRMFKDVLTIKERRAGAEWRAGVRSA